MQKSDASRVNMAEKLVNLKRFFALLFIWVDRLTNSSAVSARGAADFFIPVI